MASDDSLATLKETLLREYQIPSAFVDGFKVLRRGQFQGEVERGVGEGWKGGREERNDINNYMA
jgi:hypothetical protein